MKRVELQIPAQAKVKSVSLPPTSIWWTAYDSPQVVVRFHDGYTGKLVYAEGISLVDLDSP